MFDVAVFFVDGAIDCTAREIVLIIGLPIYNLMEIELSGGFLYLFPFHPIYFLAPLKRATDTGLAADNCCTSC